MQGRQLLMTQMEVEKLMAAQTGRANSNVNASTASARSSLLLLFCGAVIDWRRAETPLAAVQ